MTFRLIGPSHGDSPSSFHRRALSDADLPDRLTRLAGELSTTLIGEPTDTLDKAVEGTLCSIAGVLDVDRSTLVEFNEEATKIDRSYTWTGPGVEPLAMDGVLAQLPWLTDRLMAGMAVAVCDFDDLPSGATNEREFLARTGVKAGLAIPVAVGNRRICALIVGSVRRRRTWSPVLVEHLRFVVEILAAALHRRRQDRVVTQARAEVARLNRQAESVTALIKEDTRDLRGFDEIVGDSAPLREALAQVQEVAATDSTVLLLGETGTGKELFARAIHDRSPRRARPLVRVNCAALPATLIESELFGHERGAFTGAVVARQGRFELAHRGTVFLDEIGDLPLEVQAKLLRVLQEGEFERLGSSQTRTVDVRVVAATHHDLHAAVQDGRFRSDLYYRLSVFPIRLPTLRERPEDIPRLVWFFIHRKQREMHRQIENVPASVIDALQQYEWPGNVRELENVIERSMIRSTSGTLVLGQDPGVATRGTTSAADETLGSVERHHIEETLRLCGGRINGAGNAAERLGIHPNTLRFRMKKLGITRSRNS